QSGTPEPSLRYMPLRVCRAVDPKPSSRWSCQNSGGPPGGEGFSIRKKMAQSGTVYDLYEVGGGGRRGSGCGGVDHSEPQPASSTNDNANEAAKMHHRRMSSLLRRTC